MSRARLPVEHCCDLTLSPRPCSPAALFSFPRSVASCSSHLSTRHRPAVPVPVPGSTTGSSPPSVRPGPVTCIHPTNRRDDRFDRGLVSLSWVNDCCFSAAMLQAKHRHSCGIIGTVMSSSPCGRHDARAAGTDTVSIGRPAGFLALQRAPVTGKLSRSCPKTLLCTHGG